jgi:hypothetical protein
MRPRLSTKNATEAAALPKPDCWPSRCSGLQRTAPVREATPLRVHHDGLGTEHEIGNPEQRAAQAGAFDFLLGLAKLEARGLHEFGEDPGRVREDAPDPRRVGLAPGQEERRDTRRRLLLEPPFREPPGLVRVTRCGRQHVFQKRVREAAEHEVRDAHLDLARAFEARQAAERPLHRAAKQIFDGRVRCARGKLEQCCRHLPDAKRSGRGAQRLLDEHGSGLRVERAGQEPLAVRSLAIDACRDLVP